MIGREVDPERCRLDGRVTSTERRDDLPGLAEPCEASVPCGYASDESVARPLGPEAVLPGNGRDGGSAVRAEDGEPRVGSLDGDDPTIPELHSRPGLLELSWPFARLAHDAGLVTRLVEEADTTGESIRHEVATARPPANVVDPNDGVAGLLL